LTSGVVEYEVTIGFNGTPPVQVKSGMSATVDIITAEKKGVVLVPNKSIKQNNQGQKTVDVLVDQKIQERPVVLGMTDGTQTEVVSGINVGDIVIKYP
jgi:multidrug efflux pump subunit AcrA (membrane-fusion protein)